MPREVKWAISFLVGIGLLSIGWKVFAVLLVLHVLICLVLIGVILLQSGEAADLAGAFGGSGSQTAFGPRGATTFLSRATTWCAIMFMFTSLEMTLHVSTRTAGPGGSILEQFSRPAPTAPAQPGTPAAPVQPGVPSAPGTTPGQPAPAQSGSEQPATPAAPAAPPAAPAQPAPPPSQ
jgi:preprotein translocase subunit SecG